MTKQPMCNESPCNRCGCDFPNIPRFARGCGACETRIEMLKRQMEGLRPKIVVSIDGGPDENP